MDSVIRGTLLKMSGGLHVSDDGDGEEPRTYQVALQLASRGRVAGSRKMLQSFC